MWFALIYVWFTQWYALNGKKFLKQQKKKGQKANQLQGSTFSCFLSTQTMSLSLPKPAVLSNCNR